MTPCLELVAESFLLDEGSSYASSFCEVDKAALRLSFEYGGTAVAADDPATEVFVHGESGAVPVARDIDAENRARRQLESFGPLEIEAIDDCLPVPGHSADYLVDVDGDPDALCHFSAHVIPQLEALGWRVRVRENYPFHLVQEAEWFSRIGPADEEQGWFELELGVDVSGRRVDLLPVLLELLESGGARVDRLVRGHRPFMAIPMDGHRHLAVPPERIQGIMKILREIHEIDGGLGTPLRLPALVPSYLEALEHQVGASRQGGAHGRHGEAPRLAANARETEPSEEAPRKLRATLRPYQRVGLAWMQRLSTLGLGGILADDMGLGKTLQTIAHICAESEARRLDAPALVVAPTSLVGNWARELRRFAPHLEVVVMHGPRRRSQRPLVQRADVVLTTYPILVRDLQFFEKRRFRLVILDEAQTIKNARSQAHAAVSKLHAELRLCLTGTPIENNLEELRALFEFLMPHLLGDVASFRARFRVPIEKLGNEDRLASLRARVAPFVLRRMKQEVATELPPKTEMIRAVELSGDQRDLYEGIRIAAHATIRKVVRTKGIAASTVDILGALMKLRQVCCDPRLVPVDSAREIEASAKFEVLMDMLPLLLSQGRRVLIFSQFTSMLALIAEELRTRAIRHLCLTGSTGNRQQLVDDFEAGKADVFLISLKAGGTGLNLTSADTVIHYDPWWNPAAQSQATDRVYRIGQTRPVFVYKLIVAGSVEERMLELQQRKRDLADGILQGEGAATLTERDVEDLFGPLNA
jgi:superfamily II DNA or RNA helicase